MSTTDQNNNESEKQKISDLLSNERTLLAWVRTSVGIMAFGFVVVEFSFLSKDLNTMLEIEIQGKRLGYSAPIGVMIVGIGALSMFFALLRYRRTKKEITSGTFKSSDIMLHIFVILIFLISVALLVYIINAMT